MLFRLGAVKKPEEYLAMCNFFVTFVCKIQISGNTELCFKANTISPYSCK